MSTLLTTDIWKQISAAARKCKTRSSVAVAYFGKGGASMLPLKAGSKLVVDASELAVKTGQTSPAELLSLYQRGVKIYSRPHLHAKVFVFGTRLFIGSTNVSSRSAYTLVEAAFTSTNRATVQQAKDFIDNICISGDLGPEQLKKLMKLYRPPIMPGNRSGNRGSKNKFDVPKFYVANLADLDYSQGYEEPLKAGTKEAKNKRVKRIRHKLEEFEWFGSMPYKEGDYVLMVSEENGRQLVSPPGRVIHSKQWRGGKSTFIFLEVPDKRRKGIQQVSKILNKALLLRNGARNKDFATKAFQLWP